MARLSSLSLCALLVLSTLLSISAALDRVTFYSGLTHVDIKRRLDFRSHSELSVAEIEVQNTGDKATEFYLVAVEAEKVSHLSQISAVVDKQEVKVSPVEVDGVKAPQGTIFYRVQFPSALSAGSSKNLQILATFTHVFTPLPSEIAQDDSQLVVYTGNHFVFSPYSSQKQSTHIKLASEHVESRSTNEKPSKVKKDTVEYGPYKNVDAFAFSKLSVHFENNSPFVTITDMSKDIEVSHWGNVAVEENYVLKHTGAKLKGSFSRYEYQRGRGASGKASYRTIVAHLPAAAQDVYYRDQIGNISTSHVRQEGDQRVVFEVDPRFPMFGGWQTDFYMGYNLAADEVLSVDSSSGNYVLNISFSSGFVQAVVDQLTIRVILPEGASDIHFRTPFGVDSVGQDVHFTYLDTVGRPVLVLKKQNLIYYHNQPFQVTYSFPKVYMLREPAMLVFGFVAFFAVSMLYMRIELSVSEDSVHRSRRTGHSGKISNEILDAYASLQRSAGKAVIAQLLALLKELKKLESGVSKAVDRAEAELQKLERLVSLVSKRPETQQSVDDLVVELDSTIREVAAA